MDDVQIGSVFRLVRIRLGMRQSDVAEKARISRAELSVLESGQLERMSLASIGRVAAALGISLPFAPRWRGPQLSLLLDEGHARLVRLLIDRLTALGWIVRPEYTFSVHGEKGSIDVLAWHPRLRVVLIIEVKTVLVDMQDTLATIDRKRRLALRLARELGWAPAHVGSILVMLSSNRTRNALERNGPTLKAALPARHLEVRAWLKRPDRDLRGILLISPPNVSPSYAKWPRPGTQRVRRGQRRIPTLGTRPMREQE